MNKEENAKIITLCFLAGASLLAFTVQVLFASLAVHWGAVAMVYGQEWFRHGVPLLSGLTLFLFLQLRESTREWAHEVVVEVRKVVWPSRQATMGMTVVVSIILILSGLVLGVFDLAGGSLINFIID